MYGLPAPSEVVLLPPTAKAVAGNVSLIVAVVASVSDRPFAVTVSVTL